MEVYEGKQQNQVSISLAVEQRQSQTVKVHEPDVLCCVLYKEEKDEHHSNSRHVILYMEAHKVLSQSVWRQL
jgi:hypothetical protein